MLTGSLPKAVVPSVLKAARLLDQLAASRDPLPLGALSIRLDLPKSSTLSLCTSLTLAGLVRRYDDGTYHLGTHLVDLAHAYLSRTDLTREFEQALADIPELAGEGVVLAIRDGTEVVYIACRNGVQPIGVTYRIGMRLPASCTATGKALVSTLPDAEIRQLFRNQRLPTLTEHSIRTLTALVKELQQVRSRGLAIDNEETRIGMCCIGVPIIPVAGEPAVAAVAVSLLKGEEEMPGHASRIAALQALAGTLKHRLKLMM